jgi:glycosyltransferase involved in cell wall biosynthesis
MRVAIVHDWLATFTGAERVLEQLLIIYPHAELFTLVDHLPPHDRGFLQKTKIHTSWLQRAPSSRRHFRSYLPLMPFLIEQFDLSVFDLVLSSSWAFAKGALIGAHQTHVSYVHTPIRYASQLQHQYLDQANLRRGLRSLYVRHVLHKIRQWDANNSNSADRLVANSRYIARRIMKTYRREAQVIYPPVDVSRFSPRADKEDFYLAASRLVPYKRFDLVVDAFNATPHRRLVIIGDGPERSKLESRAQPNIKFLGHVPDKQLADAMSAAKAFILAGLEDFGIIVAEAQASGTPVICYRMGGASEIIETGDEREPTGVLFSEQSRDSLLDGLDRFERIRSDISPHACRVNAERFAPDRFRREFSDVVDRALSGDALARVTNVPADAVSVKARAL